MDAGPFASISKEHLTAIGRVSMRWNQAEFTMQILIWELAKLEVRDGMKITAGLNAGPLIMTMKRFLLASNEHKSHEAETNILCNYFDFLYKHRNNVVHSLWIIPPEISLSDMHKQAEATGIGLKRGATTPLFAFSYTADQINDLAARIESALAHLYEYKTQPLQALQKIREWQQYMTDHKSDHILQLPLPRPSPSQGSA